MNKVIIISIALAGLIAGAIAQTSPTPATKDKPLTCPITGDKVDAAKATKAHLYADYKGNRYYFCCDGCPQTFKKNPAKYKDAPHVKTPSNKK